MYDDSSTARDQAYEGRAIVAAFSDRDTAHAAAHELHDEGFHRTWLGVTSGGTSSAGITAAAGGTTVATDEGDSVVDRIGRFFSGESGEKTLYDELVRHGVLPSEARRIDGSLAPNSAILTVDGSNHPELAAQIIERSGGHVLAGETFGDTTTTATASAAAATPLDTATETPTFTGSRVLGYGEAGTYARGQQIDEQRRLQLREERLTVDKQQVAAGEAAISKGVVEHQMEVDVPTIREELFVERRPVSETAADGITAGTDATSIATEGEVIRVPLMREQVVVTKRPVVTEEVVIGKRQVTETQHVSETTHEETLKVNDATTTR